MTRLPAVTTGPLRRVAPWRLAAGAAGLLLAVAAAIVPQDAPVAARAASLSAALAPDTVAVQLPHAWLAAAPPRLASGDRVDVFGARPQSPVSGVALVVSDARVVEPLPEALVLEIVADDAVALAVARASAYLLLIVLRPAP